MTLTIAHAVQRVTVRLPDGRLGELIFVPRHPDGLAKVLVDRRHEEYSPADLSLVPWSRAEVIRALRRIAEGDATPLERVRAVALAALDLLDNEPHPKENT